MWTTWGPVRGGCGHLHKSMKAAAACIHRDSTSMRHGKYNGSARSDRDIWGSITLRRELSAFYAFRANEAAQMKEEKP